MRVRAAPVRRGPLQRYRAAPGDVEHLEALERAEEGEDERLRPAHLENGGVGGFVHDRGLVQQRHVEQLAVAVPVGPHLHERELAGDPVLGRERGGLADADDVLELTGHLVGGGGVGVQHDGQPRASRRAGRPHRDAPHGKVATPEHAGDAGQRGELLVEQHRERLRLAHAPTGAGSPSIGSESDAPGGIIGKTFASCSIMNSTRVGPSVRSAASSTSSVWHASSTRQPWIP